jgi:beta-barrel assembly-enhancing protease
MAGFFYNLGRMVGTNMRKANWAYRSLAGTEEEAAQAEVAVGRDLARAFIEQAEVDRDPAVEALLADLGGRLVAALRRSRYPFQFRCVLAPERNAFALPGGFIFVTRPLLHLCQGDRDELAFVLGHEVVQRHAIDRIMASSVLHAAVGRVTLAGGVFGQGLASLAASLLSQGYSQEQELEADQVGARLSAAAGFDASAAVRLLDRLAGASGDLAGLSKYFSSHPPFHVRIGHIKRALRG